MVSFFAIKGFGLLATLKNVSFNILQFWIHHLSSYLVNINIKKKLYFVIWLSTLNSNPIATKWDVNCKVCNATLIIIVTIIFLSSPHVERKNVGDESFFSQTCCKDSMKTIIILNATKNSLVSIANNELIFHDIEQSKWKEKKKQEKP